MCFCFLRLLRGIQRDMEGKRRGGNRRAAAAAAAAKKIKVIYEPKHLRIKNKYHAAFLPYHFLFSLQLIIITSRYKKEKKTGT